CTADLVLWSRTVPFWASREETTPTLTMAKAARSIIIVVGNANPCSSRSRAAILWMVRPAADLVASTPCLSGAGLRPPIGGAGAHDIPRSDERRPGSIKRLEHGVSKKRGRARRPALRFRRLAP